jgi:hypothetical protein
MIQKDDEQLLECFLRLLIKSRRGKVLNYRGYFFWLRLFMIKLISHHNLHYGEELLQGRIYQTKGVQELAEQKYDLLVQ